jgi:hypothetical protein
LLCGGEQIESAETAKEGKTDKKPPRQFMNNKIYLKIAR